MAEWKVVVQDKYPAYLDWDSFERIQAMLRDNHAEYVRNKTRGVPRDGAALLQGIVWCGQCGHKMAVQYKAGNRYVCNHLHATRGEPVVPAPARRPDRRAGGGRVLRGGDPGRAGGLGAGRMMPGARRRRRSIVPRRSRSSGCATRRRSPSGSSTASIPTTGWWRRSWSTAGSSPCGSCARPRTRSRGTGRHAPSRRRCRRKTGPRFLALGPQLPALWRQPGMDRERKKALLRSLIDKVVLRRVAAERIGIRIVWRGGEVSEDRDRGRGVHALVPFRAAPRWRRGCSRWRARA